MPWTKIYSNRTEFDRSGGVKAGLRGITYREALLEAAEELLSTDPDVFVIGEGIDDAGGAFGSTKDLHKKFGSERVMDSPLAENGITGVCVGAAAAGMRPILVHMRVDFLPLTLDQIMNHAAKWSYMFDGRVPIPLTIRSIVGRGWGSAAQHSQSLQAVFASIPGLKVVMPANPYDAKGLLKSSVYDNNPVLFIEHRWLYEHVGHVPKEPYTVEIGKGIVRMPGSDVTITAVSQMVYEAMQAATALAAEGISAEIIDLRTIRPLDADIIIKSIEKTGALVIADTGAKEFGIGAEIISKITERAFGALKAPPVRVNPPDAPVPASHALEKLYYPGAEEIIKAARAVTTAKK